ANHAPEPCLGDRLQRRRAAACGRGFRASRARRGCHESQHAVRARQLAAFPLECNATGVTHSQSRTPFPRTGGFNMKNKILPIVAVLAVLFAAPAFGADHTVKMLNQGADGMMVFEPAFLKVAPGDTVTFVPTDV